MVRIWLCCPTLQRNRFTCYVAGASGRQGAQRCARPVGPQCVRARQMLRRGHAGAIQQSSESNHGLREMIDRGGSVGVEEPGGVPGVEAVR